MRETVSSSRTGTPGVPQTKKDLRSRQLNTQGSGMSNTRGSVGLSEARGAEDSDVQHAPPARILCENPDCPNSNVLEDDGKLICVTCGFILQETQITQEVTFGETSTGAPVVQGAFVGENEETARTTGILQRYRTGVDGGRRASERTASNIMSTIVTRLQLSEGEKNRGMQVYRLAMANNMIQGRTIKEVAAACLFVGCRRDPANKVMLIDFSEILEVNVFVLGQIYSTICERLHFKKFDNLYEATPETLIQRFVRDLEFGNDEFKIAREATQILKRMKRDWILVGRRPAGVCGAAVILAARMNNYRRTVREVVYTAKVADITINKRLDEFKITESSKLTVDAFMSYGVDLANEHDPPSYYEQFMTKKKRLKRKRQPSENDDVPEIVSVSSSMSPETSASPRSTAGPGDFHSAQAEADRQAMPPPKLPIDPRLLEQLTPLSQEAEPLTSTSIETQSQEPPPKKRKAGRPKGAKNKPLPEKLDVAVEDEERIEAEMNEILNDPAAVEDAAGLHRSLVEQASRASTQDATPATIATLDDERIPTIETATSNIVPSIEDSSLMDLDDDPEVRDCLLSPEEQTIKEKIWVTDNSDWLMKVQARQIKRELAERNATDQPKKRVRRRARMGDMSQYQIQREDGSVGPPADAAEATTAMLKKRGFSKKINYEAIKWLYDTKSSSKSPTASGSRASSGRGRSTTPPPILAPTSKGVRKLKGKETLKRTKVDNGKAAATKGRTAKKTASPKPASEATSSSAAAPKTAKTVDFDTIGRSEGDEAALEARSTFYDDGASEDRQSQRADSDDAGDRSEDEEPDENYGMPKEWLNQDDEVYSDYGDEVD